MLVTSFAVVRSLDFAAAMSSGEGTFGDAGTVTAAARADGAWSACAGPARVPRRTTAVHSTAALRPGPDKLIRKPRSI
ncbi:hypothetical protein SRABI83_02799 [Arthrobacter sp. Bi83]|nr:hypothetical protein SRABI83_02799 [Arthrobacter sp. Bi83]